MAKEKIDWLGKPLEKIKPMKLIKGFAGLLVGLIAIKSVAKHL
jgi:hypothetical protein